MAGFRNGLAIDEASFPVSPIGRLPPAEAGAAETEISTGLVHIADLLSELENMQLVLHLAPEPAHRETTFRP